METIVGTMESPTEILCRSTRRAKNINKSITINVNESKDQENVNNTSLVQNNVDTTVKKDEVAKCNATDAKRNGTSTNLNSSSTPRRKKDPLANLQSNLSPKYIGYTTPTSHLNNSKEEITRSLRRRHNNSNNNIVDTSQEKEVDDISFTPNNESTVGFVRRTPRNMDSQITPVKTTKRKDFVSPIDKLLIKNGAVMENNNNLPLVDNEKNLIDKKVYVNGHNKSELDEMELGVREIENYDEKTENEDNVSVSSESCDEMTENEGTISIASEIAQLIDEDEQLDDKCNLKFDYKCDIDKNTCDIMENEEDEEIISISTEQFSEEIDEDLELKNEDDLIHLDVEDDIIKNNSVIPDNALNSDEEEDILDIKNDENSQSKECLDNDVTETKAKKEEHTTEVDRTKSNADEKETVTLKAEPDKPFLEKTFENKIEPSKLFIPNNESVKPLEITIQHKKMPLVKVELEAAEIDSNAETNTANSPSTVSMDSAKGSSITNEGSWMPFTTGDLYWGQIYNYCYWPCMVCPDPEGKTIATFGRSGDQNVRVHVRFFADNGRRNWVKRDNLMPYIGIESYEERIVEVRKNYGPKSAKYKMYVPTRKKEQVWYEAVKEANIVAEVAYSNRLEKFYEIFEKSKAFHKLEKQRRKSMYISINSRTGSDIESFYGSNDNINNLSVNKQKRERSISPYSPAYSPIKSVASKKRKLSDYQKLVTPTSSQALVTAKSEGNTTATDLNLSQTNSVASTGSHSNLLNDLEMFKSSEFRQFYGVMKDFVMENHENEKLENSLVVAVRNIWALKQLSHRQMERQLRESLTETDMSPTLDLANTRPTDESSVKRLSSRLKNLTVRKSLMLQQAYAVERPATPVPTVEKVKRLLNRPILEVIDDIFELDSKYLFKGMTRDPVCKYCLKPGGNLRRCSKSCNNWLHKECLYKDFSIKVRRVTKSLNGTKAADNETLNSSNSSSMVSLTEAGTEAHVTGDADSSGIDVICKECSNNEPTKCMVCNFTESKKADDPLVKCSMMQCERAFHPACCKYWPQAKITISKKHIESFRCPSHVCHTCVSDDPKSKFQLLRNSKLTKCVKCPATFHMDSTCIPAGSQILTAAHIICPRHASTNHDMTVNVNWCFICVGGGQLMCCETCPTALHAHCLNIPIEDNENYICEECESGRMPLYGEMVWARFTHFRWWPAIILPPTEIPKNIARKPHNPSDFVVRFFGTHDHGWISRRRVYLYLEGDSSEPPKSKSSGLDLKYNRGVQEAKQVYEIIKAKKLQQSNFNESKEKLHPQPYVRIKANRAVLPVKLHVDIESVSKCECDPREENPCGPDTNCLNRVLYHECNPKLCPAGERCQNQMFESRKSPRLDVVYMREKGFGLVCREPIGAGSFVIEYVGEVINDDEFQARVQQKSRDRDENFYFLSVEKDYIIDAGPKGNLARFMNHSCDPNCETQKWNVNSLNRVGLFAIKDIPENTELTFNYHWDDLLGNEKKTCYCGAKKCAGQIGGKIKDLETVKESTVVNKIGRGKLKTKTKPKKKLLNGGLKNKMGSKRKLKAKKTKAITNNNNEAVATDPARSEANSKSAPTITIETETTKSNGEAASTSRQLESPDIFS